MPGKGDKPPTDFDRARDQITRDSRQATAIHEAQNGTQPHGVIRTPNDRSLLRAADQRQAKTSAANRQRSTP
jgi:hypothetical protein